MKDLDDKLTSFGQFLSLLSGQLDVKITTKSNPLPNALVLPELTNMSEKDLDVLYGLCLREAGTLVKSKKRVELMRKLTTKRQMQAATIVDQARTERFLTRQFGGAGDLLMNHFGELAHDPSYQKIVLGVSPQEATPDQIFLYALKWHLLGCPKFHWRKLFDETLWDQACTVIKENPTLLETPLRKYEDAQDLSLLALDVWYNSTTSKDESAFRAISPEEKAYEKALEKVQGVVSTSIKKWEKQISEKENSVDETKKLYESQKSQYENILNPLNEQRKKLQEELRQFSGVKEDFRAIQKATRELERVEKRQERLQQQLEKLNARNESLENKLSQEFDRSTFDQKEEEINNKLAEKLASLNEKEQALQQKIDALKDKIASEGSDAKKEKLQSQVEKLEGDLNALAEKKKAQEDWANQKIEDLNEKRDQAQTRHDEKLEKTTSQSQDATSRQEAAQQALESMTALAEGISNSVEGSQESLQHGLSKVPNATSVDDVLQHMENLEEQQRKNNDALDKAQAPLNQVQNQLREAQSALKNMKKESQWQTEKELRSIEKDLQSKGLDLQLTEKMEEMEGWGEANDAQRQFDERASEETKTSVINGCGGGRGNRDLMMMVEETLSALHDLDPNEIFDDVQKLSPLAGFSENGKTQGPNSAQNNSTDNSAVFSSLKHTVWSKKFDKVIKAPLRSSSEIQKLKRENSSDIQKVKKLFISQMKPSFKPKFIGGKEEGDLDPRNLWKFAANQGDDFFEIVRKKPITKGVASIVVDLSGSMEGSTTDAALRLQKLVLLLSEGLQAIHVPHEILGYYAPIDEELAAQSIPDAYNRKSCRLETVVVKDFKEKDLSGLASLQIQQADNSDGESLRVAINRLSRQTAPSKMMFVISDGKPFMQDSDFDILDADLHRSFLEAAQKKITVHGLGFVQEHPVMGSAYTSVDVNEMVSSLEKMFQVN